MDDETRGFRISSASRAKQRPSVVLPAILALAALAVILSLLRRDEVPPITPTVQPTPQRAQPMDSTPTPTVLIEHASEWVTSTGQTVSPTPAEWRPEETPTRPPASPTPGLSQCVGFKWTETQIMSPNAHVLVDIQAANRCGRDLGALDLWFEISGWRDGDLIQTVRGHPFEPLRNRRSTNIAIGLPGSRDWYDRITVKIVE